VETNFNAHHPYAPTMHMAITPVAYKQAAPASPDKYLATVPVQPAVASHSQPVQPPAPITFGQPQEGPPLVMPAIPYMVLNA